MPAFPTAPPPHPWAPQGPRPTDGFAIASLVTGVVGLGAVPLALGIVALQRIRRNGAGGHGLAVAGIVLGAISLLASLVLATAITVGAVAEVTGLLRASSSDPGTQDASRVLIDDLVAGDCLDYGDPEDTEAVQGVDCADGHQAEVVQVVTLAGPEADAGEDAVHAAADARCSDVVGSALQATGADTGTATYDYFLPSPAGWDAGDHDVRCLVTGDDDETAELTGSLTAGTLVAPAAPKATA